MTRLLATFCVLAVSGEALSVAPPPAGETVNQLARSAGEKLALSIQELNDLRARIATEKLPLAEELTAREDRLTQLRRDHDKVSRLVDAGSLEMATIKAEMKARQDELTYVGTLLDEYARTFESKVNVSELQPFGQAIESAKQATENTTLSMAERFGRQTAFVNVSITRLFDALGGMKFEGVGVDEQGSVVKGQFAIIGPVALFGAYDGSTAGLAVPQTGSTNPLIRPLEGAVQAGIVSLISSGEGLLPLDPSRGGALKALVQKTNLIHLFEKGGPIMWPLLAASILALGTVLERVLFLMREKWRRNHKILSKFFEAVTKGDMDAAIRIGTSSKFYVVRALGYALRHKESSLESALLYAQAQELKRYRRGIPILDTVITLAPLLGLLGTVTGMMGSFSIIGGELSSPGAITGGIAEALIATAFGLGIAITALLPFNFLNARIEEARHEMESAATQLELIMRTRAGGTAASSNVHASGAHKENGNGQTDVRTRIDLQRQIDELQAALEQRTPAHADHAARPQPVAKD